LLHKVTLITNGHHLATRNDQELRRTLLDYGEAGLHVLAISRHHHDARRSANLMKLSTDAPRVVTAWKDYRNDRPELRLRLICVLQKGAVDSLPELEAYVDWATAMGVEQICFKELYVSTSVESVYYERSANQWSHAHQIPLSLVLDFAHRHGFRQKSQLPWGAPVYSGHWQGRPLQFAAYTEPSLLWERAQGMARSWNLMADGRCLVSLEDRRSEILTAETGDR
jgi:hypothetical protein